MCHWIEETTKILSGGGPPKPKPNPLTEEEIARNVKEFNNKPSGGFDFYDEDFRLKSIVWPEIVDVESAFEKLRVWPGRRELQEKMVNNIVDRTLK
jgi:hypothetical protein